MAIWDTIAAPIIAIINKVVPDKAAAAVATAQLQSMAAQGQLQEEMLQLQAVTSAQSDINKVEAGSSSLFVAGWRPSVGWICSSALAFQYIVRPVVMCGFAIAKQPIPTLPGIDDNLWQLMGMLLGMGGLRSFDKAKGVASK